MTLHQASRLAALLLPLLPLSATLRADPPRATIPAPLRAANETAEYRHLVLPNGLKVILLSDSRLNVSSASLVVDAGNDDEPLTRPGLAHFLEHMLFLGTGKYPDIGSFDAFLSSNGGNSNAYTSSAVTNYHFEIRHDAFDGGLDRFSRFFIDPLFSPEFTEREVTAIENEFQRYLQNDSRRLYQVKRELYDATSPDHHFGIGNRDTLKGTTRDDLLAFYKSHYSSDRMALALCGKASLDALEVLARKYFSEVPKLPVPALQRGSGYLAPKKALRLATVEPVKDLRRLSIEFPIPAQTEDYLSKPDHLLSALIGYEGKGSLLALLKAEGLATSLSSGSYLRTTNYGSFSVEIDLTTEGLKQHALVLERVLGYLDMLRKAKYPSTYFAEKQKLARLDEAYTDRGEGINLATQLSNQALTYPLDLSERVSYLWVTPDEAPYRRLLSELRPDNMLVTLTAKGLPADRVEEYCKIKYAYTETTGPAYDRLLSPEVPAALFLPKDNAFMPDSTDLLSPRALQLINEPGLSLYYLQDTEFRRPNNSSVIRLRPLREGFDARSAALFRLYGLCLNESVNLIGWDATEAGVRFTMDPSAQTLSLYVDGYSGSVDKFLEFLSSRMKQCPLEPGRFEAIKDKWIRSLATFGKSEAYQIAQNRMRNLIEEVDFLPEQLLPEALKLTEKDLHDFIETRLVAGKLELLLHGNLDADHALKLARTFQSSLGMKGAPDQALLRHRPMLLNPGEMIRYTEKSEGNNSCFLRYLTFPSDTPENRAASMLLGNFISEPFYSEMRTRQQLGYIVRAQVSQDDHQVQAVFLIQSGEYAPDELETRAERFIAGVPALWQAVTDEQFKTFVAGVRDNLNQKAKSIPERTSTLFSLACNLDGDWDRDVDTLNALEKLTKERVGEILAAFLAPETRHGYTVTLTAKQHEPKTPQTTSFPSREALKAAHKHQDN